MARVDPFEAAKRKDEDARADAVARVRYTRTQAEADARFEWDHYADRVHALACAVYAGDMANHHSPGISPQTVAELAATAVDAVDAELAKRKGPRP